VTGELGKALLLAQHAMPKIGLDSENPHFRSKFVSLPKLLETVRPILNDSGLVLIQSPAVLVDGTQVLRTELMHAESGERVFSETLLMLSKNDAQAQGSAITYARRYALLSMLGLAGDEDDDGKGAGKVQPKGKPAASAPAASAPTTGGNGDRPDWCLLHDCQMSEHSKTKPDGTVEKWFSHKLADGSWCNGGKPKIAAPRAETTWTMYRSMASRRTSERLTCFASATRSSLSLVSGAITTCTCLVYRAQTFRDFVPFFILSPPSV